MMRDCADGELRDLLPDFVHETLTAAEAVRVRAHVAACAECTAEVELLRAVAASFPAPTVDVRRIVAALPAAPGVGREAAYRVRRWRLAAAAAVVLAAGGLSVGTLHRSLKGRGEVSSAAQASSASASAIAVGSATSVVEQKASASVVVKTGNGEGLTFDGGLSDLTDEQVQTLLREISAIEATPSAEPESHVGHIVPVREGDRNEN